MTEQDTNIAIHEATYSAEDNKLRIYPSERLSDEEYQDVRNSGFKWAPKQELFVAPRWTPAREDLCIKYAGEIVAEGTTLAERAAAKADRLGELSEKRARDANVFAHAADQISQRFYMGQPILVGHHSERKARKDKERMESAMSRSVKAAGLSDYWAYRAAGVERHANYKNRSDVRARRIKKLLKELRDHQRRVNHYHHCLGLWNDINLVQDTEKKRKMADFYVGAWSEQGAYTYQGARQGLLSGNVTIQGVIDQSITFYTQALENSSHYRWISHTLNRLAYETDFLGGVERYMGALSASIIQGFARTHGTDKPKAKLSEEYWVLSSPVPFPAHLTALGGLGQENTLSLTDEEWRDLMQQSGYEVPDKKPAKPPLLNFNCQTITRRNRYHTHELIVDSLKIMTKEEFSEIHVERRGVALSACGTFRYRYAIIGQGFGTHYAICLSDSKQHPKPDSLYIDASKATLSAGG